jgi:predicted phage baseplate assembly protein
VAGKINPTLQQTPLTFRQAASFHAPASRILLQDPHQALPKISLVGLPAQGGSPINPADPMWVWVPQRNLLNSRASDRHFVAEMDDGGYAHLRFGDGDLGRQPAPGSTFTAHYRIGNGPQGNVGAETIVYAVTRQDRISGLTLRPCNPFPAQGGTNPEPVSDVRLVAPMAGRKVLERAITADDYATLANLNPRVQRSAAVLRWTGSWYEAQVEIDPLHYEDLGPELHHALEAGLYPFRRMGHDLDVRGAVYVPLQLELDVCVLPHYLRGHVEAALLDRFSNRKLPGPAKGDGATGFFYPDNLTFGQGIPVSAIIAAAQSIDGVVGVTARLNRLNGQPEDAIYDGLLPLSPLEIARLDNDPNFPEHGILTLKLSGGR